MRGIEKALAGAELLAARIRERGNHRLRLILSTAACLGLVGCSYVRVTNQQISKIAEACESAGMNADVGHNYVICTTRQTAGGKR